MSSTDGDMSSTLYHHSEFDDFMTNKNAAQDDDFDSDCNGDVDYGLYGDDDNHNNGDDDLGGLDDDDHHLRWQ